MFCKYAANIREDTHAKVWFLESSKSTLLKSHFRMGVLLYIWCIFAEKLFWQTPMGNYFCKLLFNMPAKVLNKNLFQTWIDFSYISDNALLRKSSPLSSRIFFVPIQSRSMWTVFCNVLLDCLFARRCLIKSLSKWCLNWYVTFSFEKFFYNRNLFFLDIWDIVTLNLLHKRYFRSILTSELSNYDPWNSLLAC